MNKTLIITLMGWLFSLSCNVQADQPIVQNSSSSQSWVSMDKPLIKLMPDELKSKLIASYSKATQNDDIQLLLVNNDALNELSELVHKKTRKCGGYIWHESHQQGQQYLENLKKVEQKQPHQKMAYTINNPEAVNALLAQINADNLTAVVQSMGNFNNRFYTSSSGTDSVLWLKSHWETIAAGRTDISVELFNHTGWSQPSVIATVQGTETPEEVVVIGGHLDSVNWSSPTQTAARAPGYDDNASGIAVVTETLNAIVQSDFRPARTVKLMGYAAEEVGLRGSNQIAKWHSDNNIKVIGAAQFDMTGYKGTTTKDIVFMSDFTSSVQNQFMAQLLDTYFPNVTYGFDPCGYACSDHASWHQYGFKASFPFESNSNNYNGDIHTSNDDHFDSAHAVNFANLSVAYVAELTKNGYQAEAETPDPVTASPSSGGGAVSILLLAGLLIRRRKP